MAWLWIAVFSFAVGSGLSAWAENLPETPKPSPQTSYCVGVLIFGSMTYCLLSTGYLLL